MIEFPKEKKVQLTESVKRYLQDEMEIEAGDLKASLLLDFFLEEIGPAVYNKAIRDAAVFMQDRAADMEGSCYETEFNYWNK